MESTESSADSAQRRRSHEALDTRVTLIPRVHRLLVTVLALLLLAALSWGFLGSISSTVRGDGVLMPLGQHIRVAQALSPGVVNTVMVDVGDTVTAGQVVATLRQPNLEAEIQATQQRLDIQSREMQARSEQFSDELGGLEATAADQLRQLQEGAESIPNSQQRELETAELQSRLVAFRLQIESHLQADRVAVAQIEAELAALRARHEFARQIVSPIAGEIYELRVVAGQAVESGDIAAVFDGSAQQLEVLSFMEPEHARLVTEGMPAHVVPRTVEEAEYGSMRGEVTFITSHPMSRQALNTWLRNPDLVDELVQAGGPYLARIELFVDPDNPSGFQWWSGTGPSFPVAAGTLADVDVIVGEQAPIVLAIPSLRAFVGP